MGYCYGDDLWSRRGCKGNTRESSRQSTQSENDGDKPENVISTNYYDPAINYFYPSGNYIRILPRRDRIQIVFKLYPDHIHCCVLEYDWLVLIGWIVMIDDWLCGYDWVIGWSIDWLVLWWYGWFGGSVNIDRYTKKTYDSCRIHTDRDSFFTLLERVWEARLGLLAFF